MNKRQISSAIEYCTVLGFLVIALTSCAIPLKQRVLSGKAPRYRGRIEPVQNPITPEYKPAEVRFGAMTATLRDGRLTEISNKGKYSVRRMRGLLQWNLIVQSLKTGDRTIAPDLAIMESQLLSEKNGKIKKVALSFPAFEDEAGMKDAGPLELNALIVAGWSYSFFTVLSEGSIRTGQTLFTSPVEDCLPKHFRNWLSKLTGVQLSISKRYAGLDFRTTLLGRSTYKGRRVIVGELNDHVVLNLNNDSETVKAEVRGYVLLDAHTLQPIKGETLLKVPIRGDPLIIYGQFLAELMSSPKFMFFGIRMPFF